MLRHFTYPVSLLACAVALLALSASPAQAQDCSDYPEGVLDGFAGDVAPAQLQIDRNCTIRNFPASNPLRTNFSFLTQPGQTDERWLIVFDNVVHTGEMACNSVAGHRIWFVNGSSSSIQEGCQNLLIPVEKIDKQNPAGTTTAAIGVPFTYTLTMPVLFDAGTQTVINDFGSLNDLHGVTVWDDLNATGVDLTYLGHTAYWRGSGAPVAHTFDNSGGQLTFDNFPIVPAGEQIVVELTVVLEDTPVNAPGTQFVNTARWDFGRLIDGVFYEPLPGESGITEPLTIAAPELVVTKTGPATLGRTLNLGEWGEFAVDVHNRGLTDAWDVTIVDRLPDGPAGGMCDLTPELLGARVFGADGVTPVPGKGPLTPGTDFTFSYSGTPRCELTLVMLTPDAVVGPDEHLIISYRTRLDTDTDDGVTLTNVAGATEWFNGDSSNPGRIDFTRQLTNGTVGVADHQDAHTVTTALFGYFFEKSAVNTTSGESPATTAAPGDTLRYTLRLQTTDGPLDDVTFFDDLGAMNPTAVFEPGTLTLVPGSIPAGADTSNTDPAGGTNGAGIIDVRNLSLPADSEVSIQFDVRLQGALLDGTVVTNQADLVGAVKLADSDDPNVNGQADPSVAGDEDPTRVVIEGEQPAALAKANTQATAAIGEEFSYRVTVPSEPHTAPLYDLRILDDLTASAADLEFVDVTKISGSGSWTPVNTGTATNLVIEDPVNGIDIPAGEQAVIEITVVLTDTAANAAGLTFTNTADYTYNQLDDDEATERPGDPGTTGPMTIVAPELTFEKDGPVQMLADLPGTFTLNVHNVGDSEAFGLTVTDVLPNTAEGGMCDAAPVQVTVQRFEADGATPIGAALAEGTDFAVTFSGDPECTVTFEMLTPAAAIGADERLLVTYRASLDADTQQNATLTNIAGATQWRSADVSPGDPARTYTRALTDGTVGVLDHEDAHTVTAALSGFYFEKTVANLTSGATPTQTAAPGDTLRYTLRLQTTESALNDVAFHDDLGELNASAVFVPGSLTLVPASIPAGADTSNTDPAGGTNGAGIIDVRNLSLPADSEVSIQFDVTVDPAVVDGTVLTNQAELIGTDKLADSDDPNVNGPADPDVAGDEDPTRVLIEAAPPAALAKANTQATAAIGEEFSYRVTVPSAPHTAPLYDLRILDDLTASAADLEFVDVTKISGSGSWTPVNTGTATNLVIEDPVNGIDIPAGEQAVIEITVVLTDTATNAAGLTFTNTADYTYDLIDADEATERPGDPGTTGPMTIVAPELTLEKDGPLQLRTGQPGTFTLNVHNVGDSEAFGLTITDVLPNTAEGGMCDAAPVQVTVQRFEADGATPIGAALAEGTDFAVTFSGDPECTVTFEMLTPAAALGADERLLVTYQASLDADTQRDTALTNVAGATQWLSADVSPGDPARTYTRALTDGTVGVLDHEDAHTLVEFSPQLIFEKTAINVSSGEDPATVATPGDTLRYRLRIENASDTAIDGFGLVDELDRLNATPYFQAGTLNVISAPVGADLSNTDANGGTAGTGLLDVRDLSLGGLGDSLLVEFEVVLAGVIANGTEVNNQSELRYAGATVALSDDPNVNGTADPAVAGDEDPTRILIESAPELRIEKVSSYVSGDPAVLLAGETLRYTISVQNVGTDDLFDAVIVDQIPANTSYVAGSTTLNGVPVPDPASGGFPLGDGIPIHAPEDPTPGTLHAVTPPSDSHVATVVFEVVVSPDVIDGTVISNQAFVSAPEHGVVDEPSDDPRTPTADDPTRDIVGNLPLLFAEKSAALQVDLGSPGIVDPGDVLRYTIAIHNNASTPATGVELADSVPANTTYVADSLTLNDLPVGQPDGGVFPLQAGIPVSSSDLTPPLPGAGAGTLSAGATAIVQFDLRVDDGVAAGTVISNQAVVGSDELADLLTDGDGDPATGPEPTVVVVGDAQLLSITKQVSVVGGGAAVAGATLEYVVTVNNVAAVPAFDVTISDDLDAPQPGQLAYVDQSATLNGSRSGVSFSGSVLTADYSTTNGPLEPGDSAVLRFRATIDSALPIGTTVTNTATVYWNSPQQSATASVSIDVGGVPGTGSLQGTVWHDANFDDTTDGVERLLEGWSVELYRGGSLLHTTLTAADGSYAIVGLPPNDAAGEAYALLFSAPGAGAATAALGVADSEFTDSLQRIDDIVVGSGANLQNLNLPIDPNGVVYDAVARTPIAGAVVTLVDGSSGAALPGTCLDDPGQQNQMTTAYGYYKFDVNFSAPSCASGGSYAIRVTPPGSNYMSGESELIPPASSASTPPFNVPACRGSVDDAIAVTTQHCEAQPSEFAPDSGVAARSAGTRYYSHLTFDDSRLPGSGQIFNNHIPLDPLLEGTVSITKTSPQLNVTRGELVPYVITVSNGLSFELQDIAVVDRFPSGFRYVEGSARVDGVPKEPAVNGTELTWSNLVLDGSGRHTIKLLLAVGAGVSEGEFINRAQVMHSLTGDALSGEATATVRLVPDPTFDCTDVTGKVFDDSNRNGYQDGDEGGLPGVRLVTASGLAATSDEHGRFHITCAITPREGRGSNFVLKLDDRTLPSGYRASTRPVQVKRATRGKSLRFNFGASIHRVVGLDIAGAVFEPGTTEIRNQWKSRIDLLLEELKKGPAVLRLSYLADIEDKGLVERRLDSVKTLVMDAWSELDCCYELVVEPEIYWRLGGPPDIPDEPERTNR